MDPTTPVQPTPEHPPLLLPDPVVLETEQGPTVFSPSPAQGVPKNAGRRELDRKTYGKEWSAVGLGLLVWSISFFAEIAGSGLTWADLTTLKFVASHAAQVLGVIAAVLGAKQIPNQS